MAHKFKKGDGIFCIKPESSYSDDFNLSSNWLYTVAGVGHEYVKIMCVSASISKKKYDVNRFVLAKSEDEDYEIF